MCCVRKVKSKLIILKLEKGMAEITDLKDVNITFRDSEILFIDLPR